MGIYRQPNSWQCGPFALKHALAVLGVTADEDEIAKIARTRRASGTDETQMERAARAYGCGFAMERKLSPERARRGLLGHLRKGIPVVVCSDNWDHWITVVKAEGGKFLVMDSLDPAVLVVLSWPQLRRRWLVREEHEEDTEEVLTYYDYFPVVPRFRMRTRPKLSIARARFLRRPENRLLARMWDDYVADLLGLCRLRTPLSANVLSLGEFLRRHEKMILAQLRSWHAAVERDRGKKLLKNMRFVADAMGMVIHAHDEKRVIAGLAVLLTLWATSTYGTIEVYPRPSSSATGAKRAKGVRRGSNRTAPTKGRAHSQGSRTGSARVRAGRGRRR